MNEDEFKKEINNRTKDPMTLMMGVVLETSMETTKRLIEVVNKYESHGIDAVPISELRECLNEGHKKSVSEGSFLESILKS